MEVTSVSYSLDGLVTTPVIAVCTATISLLYEVGLRCSALRLMAFWLSF